jgi:S1-C subfamily serine protease
MVAGLVVASTLGTLSAAFGLSSQEVSKIAKSVTVLIEGNGSTGSGILVKREGQTYTVLTAKHVLEYEGQYEVVLPTGQRVAINYPGVQKSSAVDLATFTFTSPANQALVSLGDSGRIQEGMPVYVSGFPGQDSTISQTVFNFTEGKVTALANPQERLVKNGYGLIYSNQTLPGMSGGPVLNDRGELIGVHGAADGSEQSFKKLNDYVYVKTGFNLGIPIDTVLGNVSGLRAQPAVAVATPPAPSSGSGTFLQALDAYRSGNLNEALALLNQTLRTRPDLAGAYSLRGTVRYIQEDYRGALSDFNQALSQDPSLHAAYLGRGLTYSALGNPTGALTDYTAAISRQSRDPLAFYNRGVVYLNQGQKDAAIADLQKSADLALLQDDPESYDRASEALNIAGRECRQSIRTICDR